MGNFDGHHTSRIRTTCSAGPFRMQIAHPRGTGAYHTTAGRRRKTYPELFNTRNALGGIFLSGIVNQNTWGKEDVAGWEKFQLSWDRSICLTDQLKSNKTGDAAAGFAANPLPGPCVAALRAPSEETATAESLPQCWVFVNTGWPCEG
ncbi:hypothetical protein FB451DRAFT_1189826 [Mycena latifolia]|nr:hypothetical protein FB451DRAFT_1189826 [Mycena latifolia]